MTLYRLELLRLFRTRRWLALLGVYVFFGIIGPLSARYLREIIDFAGGTEGMTIEFPPPLPADGMIQYASNAMQIGTLVALVVAAGALAFDAIPEMGVFLRTRVPDVRRILTPRLVVTTVAVVASFVAGALVAWYETWTLIGPVGVADVVLGTALGALFLCFVVALVAAMTGLTKSVLSTVLASVVVLLAMPILGVVRSLGRWLPTHLSGALGALPAGAPAGDYTHATLVTVALTALLLWVAVITARRREL